MIGPQPPVPELPAREAQTRIQRVFRDFINAVATATHPLVVFLDDLQWADASTPQLLVQLLGDGELKHVLFIGAYRDNEVTAGHLLRIALSELEGKRRSAVREIRLAPLPGADLDRLVAETLRCSEADSRPLSALLAQKTAGNPFFLNELLMLLHREGALQFDPQRGRFVWDDEKVARAAISDNVADLMVQRLQRLPPDTMQFLRLASCIGNEFDLSTLARVAGKAPGVVAGALWRAVEERLLFPLGDGYRLLREDGDYDAQQLATLSIKYRFPHDRVLQAVYSLLGEPERAAIHLSIGKLLLQGVKDSDRERKVFDFVDHLNLGRKLMTRLEERDELATLNYVAGQRARRSAAYGAAVAYLDVAVKLLSQEEWESRHARYFECCRMRVECIALSGQPERASALCDELFPLARDKAEGASVYYLKATILEHQSKLAESCEVICRGLSSLGLPLPQEPTQIEQAIGAGLGKMKAHLESTPIEQLVNLPAMTDEVETATMSLLFQLIPPASQCNPPLFILAELILFDHELSHGLLPASCKNIVDCGILLGTILNDYGGAYRMGKAAFVLLDRQMPTPLESPVNFVFGCFIAHWGSHFQEGLDALARGYQRGVELGDVLHAAYSTAHRAKNLFLAGRDLAECQTETERAIAYTIETGAVGQMAIARVVERAVARMRGSQQDPSLAQPPDESFVDGIRQTGNVHTLYVLGQTQALANFILGEMDIAARWDTLATEFLFISNGTLPVPDYYLVQSLMMAKKCRTATAPEREKLIDAMAEHQRKLQAFAEVCPANFEHKYKLASAELARVRGESIETVLDLYREAVSTAGDDFLHLRALTYELEADFWTEKKNPELGKACVFEAYYLYRRWGALAKLARMEKAYPAWLSRAHDRLTGTYPHISPSRDTVESFSLDLASVLKANHAISSEVKPERLFAVLMDTIIENAGAQHGYLILKGDDGQLSVEAKASVTAAEPLAARSMPLAECAEIAQDIVRFVVRTHDMVVVDDAGTDQVYGDDAHVKAGKVKSVLCLPVLNQRDLVAILYMENNAVTHAFTPERLGLAEVIAGQAAISISNAKLYNNLERKVAERTRELTDRNREIAALLDSMELGVFMIDAALTVEPQYS
ncbi:MAG TPA: GAF domain-containing protein, partial [Polyangiaceae bacterium]